MTPYTPRSFLSILLMFLIGAGTIEEGVVTARKITESLQEVPLTITAFSAKQLEERSVGDIRDIVSVFIDGVYYAGATPSQMFDDLQRVEFVKGPQRAFFGRSPFGGAITFIARTPDNTVRGALTACAGQFDDQGLSFSLEEPLLQDRLAARLAGSLSLASTPTDNLSARLRVSYADQQNGAPAVQLLAQLPQLNCGPFGGINRGGPGFQIDINNDGLINTAATGAARENFNAQAYLADDENIYGLDFETRALLTDQLQVDAAFALLHLSSKKLQDDLHSRASARLESSPATNSSC